MDDERWKKVEAVFLAALDSPDRAKFLDEVCGTDVELRRAIHALLDQDTPTSRVFGQLASQQHRRPRTSSRVLLAPGSELGAYRIVALLGSGGSSDVYKASDTRLGRYVALKVFAGSDVTEEFRSRFERESRAAASLNHPNIATVYEHGEVETLWYIAMEFIDGMTLRAKFADPSCSQSQRLGYLVQAAGALSRAHANGIAHCDLKPDNIMVTHEGLVKVLDFGLARIAGSSEVVAPHIEGTIGYMSPEQAGGQSMDARSDVFSFGCVLFEAATNSLPFGSQLTSQWIERLMQEPPSRLDPIATNNVSAALQALIDDCLIKDPAARVITMDEVSRRLEGILHHAPARRRPLLTVAALTALAAAGFVYWQSRPQSAAGAIAVIPFVSVERTAEGARVAEGISEGIIDALMHLPDLKVIARSSSFRFAGDSLDVPNVARTLGVQTLVTGRIVQVDGRLRITAELISGRDGVAVWGANYTPNTENLTDVQVEIAREIARRVRTQLTPADQRRLDKAIHPNAEAYALLLRGRYELSLYTPESLLKAAAHFQQALGIDSTYGMANAELANTYRLLNGFGIMDPREALRLGEQSALRAIAADEELAEAHNALAGIRRDRWQWADAEREYRRAIALSPSFVTARRELAIALTLTGNAEGAVAEVMRARELDPVGVPGTVASAAVFYNLRQFDRALKTLTEAMNVDSLAPALWAWSGIVRGATADFDRAIVAFEKAIELGDNTASTRCYYIHVLARAGRQADASRLLDTIEKERGTVPPPSLAIAYAGFGNRERAIAELEAGYAVRHPLLQYVKVEWFLASLMDDPRVRQMVAGMGLPTVQ